MKGGEEGIDEAIARALKGEIERLPPEGGDVDLRVRVKGDWVNGNKTIIVNPVRTPPPGNPNQRLCPQCGEVTWSCTAQCAHCGYDLFAFDAQNRQARVEKRVLKAMLLFGALAISGMWFGKYAPENARIWVYGFSGVCALMAMGLMKKE